MGNNSTGSRSVQAGLGASLHLDHNARYAYCRFNEEILSNDGQGAVWGTGDNAVSVVQCGGVTFQTMSIGANGSAGPLLSVDGLHIALDATANDGYHFNLGRTLGSSATTVNTNSRGAFTIGTDAPFFLRVKLDIDTVANADQIAVGFVRGQYIAAGEIELETDGFWLNVDEGDIKTESRINAGSSVATDTTQNVADAGQVTLEVQVNEDGVATAFIDGEFPTVQIAAFTFDDGDVVHAEHSVIIDASGADPVVDIMEWESGFLSTVGREFGVAPNYYSGNLNDQSYVG